MLFNCWMHTWSIGHYLCIDYYKGNNVHLANLKVIVMLLIGSCPFNVGCYVSSATYVEIYVPWMKFQNNQKYHLKLKIVHSSYLYPFFAPFDLLCSNHDGGDTNDLSLQRGDLVLFIWCLYAWNIYHPLIWIGEVQQKYFTKISSH
jgi:hypothetical protein